MYTCNQCGYNTKIKCNYIRHLNKKIKCDTNVCKNGNNLGTDGKNLGKSGNKVLDVGNDIGHTGDNVEIPSIKNNYIKVHDDKWQCVQCDKIMTYRSKKLHFEKTCRKGIDILQCEFCHKLCKNSDTKWRHKKTCKLNPINMEIKVQPNEGASSSNIATQIVNNYYVNTVNNNTVNNNNNLTVNNNNSTNITFTSFGRENLEHLTSQVMIDPRINNIRKCYRDTVDLSHFNADHPENHTIRKTNLKSNLIEFRTHQNKWEYESDKAGFRKIRKNLEEKFKTKFDDVDDMTLTAFNEMLYRQTQRGPVPEEEILNKYKSIKYVEAMCDAQVEKQRIKYLDEMEIPHDHNIPIYGRQELRVQENELRNTYGLPLKPEIEFVSCTQRWRND